MVKMGIIKWYHTHRVRNQYNKMGMGSLEKR